MLSKTVLQSISAIAVAGVLVVGCAEQPAPERGSQPQTVTNVDMTGDGPGTLVSATTMPGIDEKIKSLGARAVRVVYRSTSGIDGSSTEVSAAVFTPAGAAPPGGWPVMTFAHGTTGIQQDCAPSLQPDLLGETELVSSYLKLGFAVAATDYQGLGAPGVHPYLNARTAGLNIIDSVRALRRVSDGVSARWGAFGGSQGGAATWAANEQSAAYAPELTLVGTVSLVPAADVSGLVQKAVDGTLTRDQMAAYILLLNRVDVIYPDLGIDDFRRGIVADNWDALGVCGGPQADTRAQVLTNVEAADLVPATADAADRLRRILQSWALPQVRAASPMDVFYGGADQFIDSEWTRDAIGRACALGDTINTDFQPDKGHGDIDGSASIEWLGERFAGTPAPNTCQPVPPVTQ